MTAKLPFKPYISEIELLQGVVDGDIIRGHFCVNAKKPSDAFIRTTQPYFSPTFDGDDVELAKEDIIVRSLNWNRAIDGDLVGVKILPQSEWVQLSDPPSKLRQAGVVVHVFSPEGKGRRQKFFCILRANRPRADDSQIRDPELHIDWRKDKTIRAIPLDRKLPWIIIPVDSIDFRSVFEATFDVSSDELPEREIYQVEIIDWKETSRLPMGKIVKHVGQVGDPATEEYLVLHEFNLLNHAEPPTEEVEQFTRERIEEMERNFPSLVTERVDLRGEKIFTIDPETARDLDDAIHVKHVPKSGKWDSHIEVGVHIADVSYFVKPGTCLDEHAVARTTTVYLPSKAHHMLPKSLSQTVCSLIPGRPRLSFTCRFYLNPNGSLFTQREPEIFKSIIESRYQLNYDDVDCILDAHRSEVLAMETAQIQIVPTYLVPETSTKLEDIKIEENKIYPLDALYKDLCLLENITQAMRRLRFENGSMSLNKVQLRFRTDGDTGLPLEVLADKRTSSHELIEELMLMANKLVAEHLIRSPLSLRAVLRHHPCLDPDNLPKLYDYLEKQGLENVDLSTSRGVQALMTQAYKKLGPRVGTTVEQMIIEKMRLAAYGVLGDEEFDPKHFALSFDAYTHFTSPIRRYPDILVHRLLDLCIDLKSMGVVEEIDEDGGDVRELLETRGCLSIDDLSDICQLSNGYKESSKKAQEKASVAWLLMYLLSLDKIPKTCATVLTVADQSLMLHITEFNLKKRIEYQTLRNSKRLDTKLMDRYSDVKAPIKYDVSEDKCEIVWSDNTKQDVKVNSAIPIYILPTKHIPIDFLILPIHPKSGDYKELMQIEKSRWKRP